MEGVLLDSPRRESQVDAEKAKNQQAKKPGTTASTRNDKRGTFISSDPSVWIPQKFPKKFMGHKQSLPLKTVETERLSEQVKT